MADPTEPGRRTSPVRWLLITAVILGLGYLGLVLAQDGNIARGTTVAGVDIGGLTPEQAAAVLSDELEPRMTEPVIVDADQVETELEPDTMGFALDATATAQSAASSRWNPLTLISGGSDVAPVFVTDEKVFDKSMVQIAEGVDKPLTEPAIVFRKTTPRVRPGESGRQLDNAASLQVVEDALLVSQEPIDLVVRELPPTVSAEAADAAVEQYALPAVSAPMTLIADGVSATLEPIGIARALIFEPRDGDLVPVVRGNKVHERVRDAWVSVETPGRDASFAIRNGRPVVVPSKRGNGVSDDDLAAGVAEILTESGEARTASFTVTQRDPDLTTKEARALNITEQLSSHTENFPYAQYREINIGQAAKYMDGTVLLPGETYSMNDTVKERTEANGYTVGYVVGQGGRLEEAQGGGVSTVATATWVAAFYAGLERIEQRAHTIWIPRYQAGLEATVAWGFLDVKVKNNTGNGVLITASTTPTSITVEFWGTRTYDDIRAEFGPKYNIVPFDSITDSADGCVSNTGVEGFDIDVDRVFYQAGEEVKRETFTTNYDPAPRVTCTGAANRIQ